MREIWHLVHGRQRFHAVRRDRRIDVAVVARNSSRAGERGVTIFFGELRAIGRTRSADIPLTLGLIVDASGSQEHFVKAHHHDLQAFLKDVLKPADRAFLIDTPRNYGSEIFQGLSVRQQWLDVVQLHKCLLENVLGLSEESIRNQENIRYLRDAAEALEQVRSGNAQVAFLMNPVRMAQVRDIAFAGEVLPQKSTDFYPKLLSGLTIYGLE